MSHLVSTCVALWPLDTIWSPSTVPNFSTYIFLSVWPPFHTSAFTTSKLSLPFKTCLLKSHETKVATPSLSLGSQFLCL